MTYYPLNEKVYQKIENILENPKPVPRLADQTYYKSVYGPATLINDWYEKTTTSKQVQTSSEPPISENMDKFRPFCVTSVPDRQDYFCKIFENYGLGQELLIDHLGQSFYDNYATTNDLIYNHLNKGICGPYPRRYHKGQYKPETDLTRIFGNLTQWGLKERILCETKSQSVRETFPTSETFAEFKAYDWTTVKKINDFPTFKKIKVYY